MIYPWQTSQWQHFLQMQKQNRLPHAILLQGKAGLGKKTFALAMAEGLLCDNPHEGACGVCRSCHLFRAGNHPDFFAIYPKEDAQSIKVDQIRELIASLHQTPQRGRYQVVVIHPAETLNIAAFNALLKTLEEPPGFVVMMLVTNRRGLLPATIVSRCQPMCLFATVEESLSWLESVGHAPNTALKTLLKIAHHSPLLALDYHKADILHLRNALLDQLISLCRNEGNVIDIVSDYAKTDVAVLLYLGLTIALDVLRLQLSCHQHVVHQDQLEKLILLQQALSKENVWDWITVWQRSWQLFQSAVSVNVTLLLENIFLTFQEKTRC